MPAPDCESEVYACLAHYTGGVAVGDLDGDGWPDVLLTRPEAPSLVYRNQGDGTFEEVGGALGVATLLGANGVALADVDADGDLDVLLSRVGYAGIQVLANRWPMPFLDVTSSAGLDGGNPSAPNGGSSIAAGDFDRDGLVDVYVAEWLGDTRCGQSHQRLYRGLGPTGATLFDDVTERLGVLLGSAAQPQAWSFGAGFPDLDADGWPDLLITSDFGTSRLFFGGDSQAFVDETASAGVGTEGFGMGATVADLDGDGRLDVYVSSITLDPARPHGSHRLYLNQGARRFLDATDRVGLGARSWGWGVAALDADHDGDLDLVSAAGLHHQTAAGADPLLYLENQGGALFVERAADVGLTNTLPTRGLAVFDYDRDGDQDVLIVRHGDTPLLYRNDSGVAQGDYLRVRARGTRGNRFGLGAVVHVSVDGRTWVAETSSVSHFLGQSELVAHFGLGPSAMSRSATVRVTFLGGHEVTLAGVALNQELQVTEPDAPFPNAPSVVPAAAADCNSDGVPDACAPDCDRNRRPDSCDVAAGSVPDCNMNGVPDACDVAAGFERDCDLSAVPDACEIALQPALDCDADGWLDTCRPSVCGGADMGAADAGSLADAGGASDMGAGPVDAGPTDAGDLSGDGSADGGRGSPRGCSAHPGYAGRGWGGLLVGLTLWRRRTRRSGLSAQKAS